ncbi:MAG: hypothetical protein MUP85_04085 [Candidatus Lokiarchaeota archaeon]|nr:hypothetical protein [Candidatus Lokiarchaeota archaeon]
MKNASRKIDRILIISFVIVSIISICLVPNANQKITSQDFDESDKLYFLNVSDNGLYLNYSDITRNATSAYRLFDSVLFTVNTSGFSEANSTFMKIEFNNITPREYEMERESGTDIFTHVYIAEYDTPLGFHNITFGIFDVSKVQLNDQTTKTNITIKSNYIGFVNSSYYARNQKVYGELMVIDFGPYNLEWNVAVVNNDNESLQSTLFDLGMNIDHFTFNITDSFEISDINYYVKINMSDTIITSKVVATYIPFKVLATVPTIVEASINISLNPLKRNEDCVINLNVTDIDPLTVPENITVTLKIQAPDGQNLSPLTFTNNEDWTFSRTFSISINRPIGIYQVTIEAKDQYDAITTYTTTINVENNAPKIHDYWINSLTIEQQVSVNYGDDLIFTFNVSDVENTIAYITVSLLDENNNWYNITNKYSSNMELIIRTEELISGVWYVYLSVIDADGAITRLTSDINIGPKEIRIIPDLISTNLPWIALFSGLGIGLIFGFGFGYSRYKSSSTKISKEKQKASKEKAKITPKQIKPEKKQKQIVTEKPDDTEDKTVKSETGSAPQRKIKRRLN